MLDLDIRKRKEREYIMMISGFLTGKLTNGKLSLCYTNFREVPGEMLWLLPWRGEGTSGRANMQERL